uniref:SEA domain-containing protein n=1 Tax=Anopheles maculatus TaxID=74869 RepID=A0A182SVN6_9DIPT
MGASPEGETNEYAALNRSSGSGGSPGGKSNGLDNPGFELEHDKRPLSSFGHTAGKDEKSLGVVSINGKTMGEKPLAEAVNLELLNMSSKPSNGHHQNGTNGTSALPVKKDTEVDLGDPYDEYFVPVNEHRKFMRGEKLYVTKDKREKKRKNWPFWLLGLAVLLAVIIVAILAGSGVIFNDSPTPVESRQFGDKVAAAGVFGGGKSRPGNASSSSTVPNTRTSSDYPTTPSPPSSTLPPVPPSTEEITVYVPNTLEGQITLANVEFLEDYRNPNSSAYKTLAMELEEELKDTLSTPDARGPIYVKILNMKPGSVVVDYRVSWEQNTMELSEDAMKLRLNSFLQQNGNYLSTYIVPTNTIRVARLPDVCVMRNSGKKQMIQSTTEPDNGFTITTTIGHQSSSPSSSTTTDDSQLPDFMFVDKESMLKHSSTIESSTPNELVVSVTEQSGKDDTPAPVTETIVDDTPMPSTSSFFVTPKPTTASPPKASTPVNGFEGRSLSSNDTAENTVYATSSPISLEQWRSSTSFATSTEAFGRDSERQDETNPFLPSIETSSSRNPASASYAVTETVVEAETTAPILAVHNESPFLPETENNASLVKILHEGLDRHEGYEIETQPQFLDVVPLSKESDRNEYKKQLNSHVTETIYITTTIRSPVPVTPESLEELLSVASSRNIVEQTTASGEEMA